MTKLFSIKNTQLLFIVISLLILPFSASASGFTANADFTVADVAYGDTAVDMTILSGSAAASFSYDAGIFTITDPSGFNVSCQDSSVYGIRAVLSSNTAACVKNTDPGITYLTLPNTAGEYTIEPIDTNLSHALTYNSSCGAATCESGYTVSGLGANAICSVPSGGTPFWILQQPKPVTPVVPSVSDEEIIPSTPEIEDTPSIGVSSDTPAPEYAETIWRQILSEGEMIATSDVSQLVAEIGQKRDLAAEGNYSQTIVETILRGTAANEQTRNAITNFVTYGTQTTEALGAGERAGVVNSFKSAFGKLPTTQEDWNDVIKISNGRWPGQTNLETEKNAQNAFRKIYLRNPDRNPHDDAAITVMAYGLRPANRNMDSERAAIGYFTDIYRYNPKTASAWDIVRAIAYSGAKR